MDFNQTFYKYTLNYCDKTLAPTEQYQSRIVNAIDALSTGEPVLEKIKTMARVDLICQMHQGDIKDLGGAILTVYKYQDEEKPEIVRRALMKCDDIRI